MRYSLLLRFDLFGREPNSGPSIAEWLAGPGYLFSLNAKNVLAAKIYGRGAWKITNDSLEPVNLDDTTARHEAVLRLINNHDDIAECCARAAGEPGKDRPFRQNLQIHTQ